jgi:hypothetical protein
MNFKSFLFACSLVLLMGTGAFANNMLVQNVTTLGNDAVNRTIQVQFDVSWDNSWRDEINYDAAWIFMKFKNASGVWQHVQLNQTGFVAGTGTANTVQVTADKVGSWLYRSGLGSGTFTSTGMQLQWNYGLAGLTSVTGLEVRVFAVEMVYVPEGEFNVAKGFYIVPSVCCSSFNGSINAPGSNFPVINTKLTPTLTYSDGTSASVRIKGDAGIDTNNDGVIDNTTYPIGYKAFYCYKYELTEQQYADFLNTLTTNQISTLGVAGTTITLANGQYFASSPNLACGNANAARLFAYADWSGIRPMSILEFNKATFGPLQPVFINACCPNISGYAAGATCSGCWPQPYAERLTSVGSYATVSSNRGNSGATFYGCLDFTGNSVEPVVKLNSYGFTEANGNGSLTSNGNSDISTWLSNYVIFVDQFSSSRFGSNLFGFRYVRSAE